ncbi:DNA polymerase III subunit gamma/tau [Amphritea pacifica]|uniref:DNA polymerase III subunit gamma/tau n=1 Tax=Amphritea pacifica TaxID=2811233 RepID=A0ABS2WCH2_9GAMM|nr:DNA polymerase III subunit gamma/tau [Amphritea pacifica]MBN0989419.1 DNA polymerase III subunit gamma/tau [Amphritea pacifica]MBN1006919.1 DNA polymerase III subunit gamma/tau [Amphritea pacifica]
MSYQVLARKWRPAKFQEMVGQEHVLKALVNALDDDRLHHAYLFTGTRGVGKTSIARLFAKSLNCETGVSSTPCGECSACREISEGRFVDLIEVDAASRTKVEDTRELMENVQYAPTHGRFKVYLIDEVHMLSTHSFNALLKTLEEPPPHVKFLLATTDPQKLPVTILSRCLQFNLKNMIPERIVEHLCHVLTAENIPYEEPALWLLARSADGSMRDALSLTDQAIAFGAGSVVEADVRAMLGSIDQRLVYRLVDSLAAHDAKGLLTTVEELARYSPDYNAVLGDLISLMHRIALAQIVPDAVDNGLGDRDLVLDLAGKLTAEDVQLFYQTALMGRKDLPFVPDAREGVEMTLMRMLAFRPVSVSHQGLSQPSETDSASAAAAEEPRAATPVAEHPPADPSPAVARQTEPQIQPVSDPSAPQGPQDSPPDYDESYLQGDDEALPGKKPETDSEPPVDAGHTAVTTQVSQPGVDLPWEESSPLPSQSETVVHSIGRHADEEPAQPAVSPAESIASPQVDSASVDRPELADQPEPPMTSQPSFANPAVSAVEKGAPTPATVAGPEADVSKEIGQFMPEQWVLLVELIGLTGMTYSIASNTSLESVGDRWCFHYTNEQKALISETHIERIRESIGHYFNQPVEVEFSLGSYGRETPSQYRDRKRAERLAQAVSSIQNDPVVHSVIERFAATIDLQSVQPID